MKTPTASEVSLRKAREADGPFLLAVRNSPDVRAQSKTQEVIAEADHGRWLATHLREPGSVIWIIEAQGKAAGYIRAQEIHPKGWLLSIALEAAFRGKGYGKRALQEACRRLVDTWGAQGLMAEVLTTNTAAEHLFDGAGFVRIAVAEHDGRSFGRFELKAAG